MEKINVDRLAMLRKPFEPHQISKLPKPKSRDAQKGHCKECGGYHGLPAVHLDYVGHAALTDRLLDVDPTWTWEPASLDERGLPALDKDGGLWIKLTICGVTRLGYGDAQGKTGGDAMKERIGDALRNAAMRFGAALDLWHKGDLHGPEEDQAAPAKPAAKPAAVPTPKPMDTQEVEDCCLAMRECEEVEALKSIFAAAWKRADTDQRVELKHAYDARLIELTNPTKKAA